MKCKVIKEYAGIVVGTQVNIPDKNMLKYMVSKGYVEHIEENKADNTEYKTKVIEVPKNKGVRPKTKK